VLVDSFDTIAVAVVHFVLTILEYTPFAAIGFDVIQEFSGRYEEFHQIICPLPW
jgi:hypothetical protein